MYYSERINLMKSYRIEKERIALLIFLSLLLCPTYSHAERNLQQLDLYAQSIRNSNIDSSLYYFKQCKDGYLKTGDTLSAINTIINISNIYTSMANYSKSYDGYWEGLLLLDKIADSVNKGKIYDGIALLYNLFKRDQEAEWYLLKSVDIKKSIIANNVDANTGLVNTYYLLAIYYRERENFDLAKKYLDSCRIELNRGNRTHEKPIYIDAEQAYLNYHDGKYSKAIDILVVLEQEFLKTNESYLVILYSFLGDIYAETGKLQEAWEYYHKSLITGKEFNSHQNFVPEVHKKLADLYVEIKNYKQAYRHISISRHLNDSLFGARSINNNSLLQIKDEYRLEKEKQQNLLKQSKIRDLEQQRRIWLLRNIVLLISLIIIVIVFFGVFWYLKSRQKIMRYNQKINTEKNQEFVEIKNRELTSSALQLIEKDELLTDIKDKLEQLLTKQDLPALRELVLTIKTNTRQDWKEFNARFTSVNHFFYEALGNKFPKLTQSDHKLCALIKLNFSSKEMARLLGISIESVHTSRYRLRKKMDLRREDNLTEFIARL